MEASSSFSSPSSSSSWKALHHPDRGAASDGVASRQGAETGQELQPLGFSHGLIGRKAEFQTLKKGIEDLNAGRGGITLVTGVKGMGKSFLVNQVHQHFARQNALLAAAQSREPALVKGQGTPQGNREILWLRGRCRSYSHLRPYSMWLDLMHEWLGTQPEDQAGQIQLVLREQMETQ